MGTREITMHQAFCDRCGAADKEADHVAWTDAESAVEVARESGFLTEVGDRWLCVECWTWSDDEDEIVERAPVSAVL